jgi:hypothetical protein
VILTAMMHGTKGIARIDVATRMAHIMGCAESEFMGSNSTSGVRDRQTSDGRGKTATFRFGSHRPTSTAHIEPFNFGYKDARFVR